MASAVTPQVQAASQSVKASRLWWAGPLTIVVAVIVNAIIRLIAVSLLGVSSEFPPLQAGPPVVFSIIGVLGAVIVFAIIARFATRPIALFRRIAIVVLIISLVPDILLYTSNAMPGSSLAAVLALMLMHVAAFAICFTLLPRLTAE